MSAYEYGPWQKKFAFRRKMQNGSVIWFRSYYQRTRTISVKVVVLPTEPAIEMKFSSSVEEVLTLFDVLKRISSVS